MVRNIITFLVRIGMGEIPLNRAKKVIRGSCPYVNKPAEPGGLYLVKVYY